MSRRQTRRDPEDLDEYHGCPDDAPRGLVPLAVGWLRRDRPYESGGLPPLLVQRLRDFCHPDLQVCRVAAPRPCPLCGEQISIAIDGAAAPLGGGEIRVIGEDEIFAAPALIFHYVTVHGYQPPRPFVAALRDGPPAGATEHRALVRFYRG